ncbi:TPA: DUF2806 domain-containing protein [Clostridioides difficile]|uniref:DUF2806 domain-containing protein n=1 Tax=Clostridioides difficile TaxID=1496 RepID=UPI00038CBC66|nr:DUF2806 domain-containing protein [Clostridioides difficile]EGT5081721.1 DUF2806 domain-containing protein [Clostridioides difficile]EGT5134789.1 DUF2806 domain-containing protein [Clostridioides difficile]EGT5283229.1 DUF2806 domain-containing protein [Clostridioides difficile]EQK05553.1 hypothetical protein QUI_2162 [Clostridioides difficile P59]MBG0194391.1 DUF2806 domain-containing protein [Clostridioides difficile]
MDEEKNKYSLIDISNLSEPIIKLIDTLSIGIGTLYEPTKIKRTADATAYEMKTLKESTDFDSNITIKRDGVEITIDKSGLQENAIISLVKKEVKRQINKERIISRTVEFIDKKETVSKESVDNDWITRFFNISQDVSDEKMQILWAKILADEVDRPKSYSLRTLETLKNISKEEAELFTRVVKLTFNNPITKFIPNYSDILLKKGITLSELMLLNELNLITSDFSITKGLTVSIEKDLERALTIGNKKLVCSTKAIIRIPAIKLTNIGTELSKLIDFDVDISYLKEISEKIEEENKGKVRCLIKDIDNE